MRSFLLTCISLIMMFSCNQADKGRSPGTGQGSSNHGKDPALVGLWKGTEILGTGGFTMTNETMIEFLEDGTLLTWPGRSVGPDYSRDEDKGQASKGTWYTSGNSLHMIDPATGHDAETYYSVNESGLVMSNGSQKKPFERVR